MATVGRLKKDGSLRLKDVVNERLPVITNGLIAHYPLDSPSGGIDIVGGGGTNQNIEVGANFLDATGLPGGWRNPSNWTQTCYWDEAKQAIRWSGYSNAWMNVPVVIDSTKTYEIQMSVYHEVAGGNLFYAGGRCHNSAGQKVTVNETYFLALSNAYVTGQWFTYRVTISGTGNITYQTSTTFATTCGWTGDGTPANGDKLTKYYYFGALFNYNSGGVMYIKDCIVRTTTANTSNTVATPTGMAVEESTTNLILYPNDFNSWTKTMNSGSAPTVVSDVQASPLGAFEADKITIPNDGTYPRIYQNWTPANTNSHTFSIWLKAAGGACQTTIVIFRASPWNVATNGGPSVVTVTKDWQKFSITFNPLDTSVHLVYIGSHDSTKGYVFYAWGAFLENRAFSTSFVPVSHTASNLKIPLPFGTAIAYPFTASVVIYNDLTGGQNGEGGEPSNAYPLSWWETAGGYKGILNQRARSNAFFQVTKFRCTIIFRASTFDIYFDTTAQQSAAAYYNSTPSLLTTALSLGTRNNEESLGRFNGRYSNLSVWNRELSVTEIQQLVGETMEIGSTGTMTTPGYIESVSLPLSTYYFPLADDTKDITNTIDAYTNTNVVFEDQSAWVGTATTNLVSMNYNNGTSLWGSYNYDATSTRTHDFSSTSLAPNKLGITRYVTGTTGYKYFDVLATTSSTTNHAFSYYAKASDSVQICTQQLWRLNGVDQSVTGDWNPTFSKYFKKYATIGPATAGGTLSYFPIHGNSPPVSGGYTVWYSGYQLEAKPFPSPFTSGSRAASNLSYNLYSSIGLDWNGNWTIAYWKKPVATSGDNFTVYNIESLGSSPNSIGGGYVWWGKSNGADTVGTMSVSFDAVTIANYWNVWQFVSIVKNGTTVTHNWKLNDGQVITKAWTIGTVASNYMVNQYGYDFQLGGWNNANPTNTFFRDLVVIKSALSDAELTLMYRQLKSSKDNTISTNLLEEGI